MISYFVVETFYVLTLTSNLRGRIIAELFRINRTFVFLSDFYQKNYALTPFYSHKAKLKAHRCVTGIGDIEQ